MSEQESYYEVLSELASSRGFESAEEVARRAAELDPSFTVRKLVEEPAPGYGGALNEVLHLDDQEMRRLVNAFIYTFWRP